jgi:enoyl-CoA hydratase/carnithine racemase
MENFKHTRYRVDKGVAEITLCSGDGLNTQSVESVKEWVAAVTRANEDDSVGAILFTAEGKGFSAGGNMEELFLPRSSGEIPYDKNDPYTGGINLFSTDWVQLLRQSKPVVVAFNGFAVGGGVTLFLPADVLVASPRASFHFSFVKVGIVAEICSTKYLPARVGFGRASELLLSGRAVGGQEAHDMGLVDYLYPEESLLDEARKIATTIAGNPAPMLRMTKTLLDQNSLETQLDKVWERESNALWRCFHMEEHKTAIKSFLSED